MDILMYLELAKRLESIERYSGTLCLTREEILAEIRYVAANLRDAADQLDREMDERYLKEFA